MGLLGRELLFGTAGSLIAGKPEHGRPEVGVGMNVDGAGARTVVRAKVRIAAVAVEHPRRGGDIH